MLDPAVGSPVSSLAVEASLQFSPLTSAVLRRTLHSAFIFFIRFKLRCIRKTTIFMHIPIFLSVCSYVDFNWCNHGEVGIFVLISKLETHGNTAFLNLDQKGDQSTLYPPSIIPHHFSTQPFPRS